MLVVTFLVRFLCVVRSFVVFVVSAVCVVCVGVFKLDNEFIVVAIWGVMCCVAPIWPVCCMCCMCCMFCFLCL